MLQQTEYIIEAIRGLAFQNFAFFVYPEQGLSHYRVMKWDFFLSYE